MNPYQRYRLIRLQFHWWKLNVRKPLSFVYPCPCSECQCLEVHPYVASWLSSPVTPSLFGNEALYFRDSPVTPQLLHHVFHLLTVLSWCQLGIALGSKFSCIHLSKLLQGESPAMEARAKANGTNDWINLRELTKTHLSNECIPRLLWLTLVMLTAGNGILIWTRLKWLIKKIVSVQGLTPRSYIINWNVMSESSQVWKLTGIWSILSPTFAIQPFWMFYGHQNTMSLICQLFPWLNHLVYELSVSCEKCLS